MVGVKLCKLRYAGPRWVRVTRVEQGHGRSPTVAHGSEEPQVAGPLAHAAGITQTRDSDCGPEGRGFESPRSPHFVPAAHCRVATGAWASATSLAVLGDIPLHNLEAVPAAACGGLPGRRQRHDRYRGAGLPSHTLEPKQSRQLPLELQRRPAEAGRRRSRSAGISVAGIPLDVGLRLGPGVRPHRLAQHPAVHVAAVEVDASIAARPAGLIGRRGEG